MERKATNENMSKQIQNSLNTNEDRMDNIILSNSKITSASATSSMTVLSNKVLSNYLMREESGGFSNYPGVETMEYDYAAERRHYPTTRLVETIFYTIKGCISAGIMGIHEAYKFGGIWTSLASTVIIGFLCSYCMYILVKSAQRMYSVLRTPKLTYSDLAEVAVATGPLKQIRRHSKIFRHIIDVFLLVTLCGSCCAYQVMMGSSLKRFAEIMSDEMAERNMSIRLYILMSTILLVGLCMVRLRSMGQISLIADIFVGVSIIVTVSYGIPQAPDISDAPPWKDKDGFFHMLTAMLFSVEGVTVSLPIENHMKSPKYFRLVLQFAMPVVIICTAAVGFVGYWVFGEGSRSPITLHLPSEGWLAICVHIALVFVLGVIFSVHFYIPFKIVWHYLSKSKIRYSKFWVRIYKGILLIVVTASTLISPNILTIMSFVGAYFMVFIVFIFPALIEIMVTWNEKNCKYIRITKDVILICIGLAMMIGHLTTL